MTAPTSWSVNLLTTRVQNSDNPVTYRGGYWFLTELDEDTADVAHLFYATSPTVAWTQVTAYTPDAADDVTFTAKVEHDGTDYATVVSGLLNGDTYYSSHIFHATDPAGTWSRAVVAAGTGGSYRYLSTDLTTDGTTWVVCGIAGDPFSSSTRTPFIATASSPGGTWTVDPTPTGLPTGASGIRLHYADGLWVYIISEYIGGSDYLNAYTATDPTGTWTACASFPTDVTDRGGDPDMGWLKWENGYWVIAVPFLSGTASRLFHASDPTGTWSAVTQATAGLASGERFRDVTYSAGAWLVSVTAYAASGIRYLSTVGDPSGSYVATTGTSDRGGAGLDRSASHIVCAYEYTDDFGAWSGDIGYSTLPSTRPSYLRQRQSPRQSIRIGIA